MQSEDLAEQHRLSTEFRGQIRCLEIGGEDITARCDGLEELTRIYQAKYSSARNQTKALESECRAKGEAMFELQSKLGSLIQLAAGRKSSASSGQGLFAPSDRLAAGCEALGAVFATQRETLDSQEWVIKQLQEQVSKHEELGTLRLGLEDKLRTEKKAKQSLTKAKGKLRMAESACDPGKWDV